MLELFIPPVALLAVSYVLIRRAQRPKVRQHSPAPLPSPAPAAAARAWRDAARESDTLRIAVEQMIDHCDLAQQSADAWLLTANLNVREPQLFRRNVLEAQAMTVQLEEECAAVVEELRSLERMRDQTSVFEQRRVEAEAFVAWAKQHEAALRKRLNDAAVAAQLDPGALREEAARRSPVRAGDHLEQLLSHFADEHAVPLRSVVG
jgi:hypothetical protein